jgi:hypothetical protein
VSGEWFANYVKAPRHPGKGRVIRALLGLLDGRRLPSVYGPLMTVRSQDATNRFALLGTLAEDYRDVHAQIMAMAPGDCFIDIGANLGLFTMVASRHLGPEGRVVAFEPNHTTFADLAGNLAANACTNVVTVCAGVSNTTARVASIPARPATAASPTSAKAAAAPSWFWAASRLPISSSTSPPAAASPSRSTWKAMKTR